MSTAPHGEEPTLPHFHRVLCTPVGDLLHGRIGPRATIRQVVNEAALPAALAELVLRVVGKTRLWAGEKLAVAQELVAHFQDGLAAGAGENDLLASFGNAKQAARLIRRAKLRGRPLAWKFVHLTKRTVQVIFALLLVAYGVQAVRLYRHSPKVTRNYVAEWNAPSLAVPEDERAWPIYRTAVLGQHGKVPAYEMADLDPASPNWAALNTYIADNDSTLELCRRAAAMPQLGAVLDAEVDSDLLQALGFDAPGRSGAPASVSDNPDFRAVQSPPQCAALRGVARLLALDARIAAVGGNAQRAATDIDALHGVVEHAFQLRLLIGDLVGLAIGRLACDTAGGILYSYPDLLSDAALTSLAHRLAVLGGGPELRLNFAAEYATFEDVLQRYYTDDGHGDGLPTTNLMRFCSAEAASKFTRAPFGALIPAAGPVVSTLLASRHEVDTQFRALMARVELEARVPLWERSPSEVERELQELTSSPLQELRHYPIALLFPSYSRCIELFERATQVRDATLVAIALELYRRQAGRWPDSLDKLAPQFLPQVPPDRYDGKPLKYRVIEAQPLLYSVGVNRIDDGGRLPEPQEPNEKSVERNQRAREWAPVGTPELPDGDWILWPPVEE